MDLLSQLPTLSCKLHNPPPHAPHLEYIVSYYWALCDHVTLAAAANAGLLHPHRSAQRVLQLQQDQQHRPQHGVSRQLQAALPGASAPPWPTCPPAVTGFILKVQPVFKWFNGKVVAKKFTTFLFLQWEQTLFQTHFAFSFPAPPGRGPPPDLRVDHGGSAGVQPPRKPQRSDVVCVPALPRPGQSSPQLELLAPKLYPLLCWSDRRPHWSCVTGKNRSVPLNRCVEWVCCGNCLLKCVVRGTRNSLEN